MDTIPIRSPFPGAACYLVPVTDSTMDEARRLTAAGFPEGTVVAAERQNSGRGRFRDRAWVSEPGRDLTFTVALPGPTGLLPGLPLRAGLALLRSIEAYARIGRRSLSAGLSIKWPNDVLYEGRKLAGILCENTAERCYVGVGVNCGGAPEGAFRTEATGLAEILGVPADRFRLLELFLEQLVRTLAGDDWSDEVSKQLWLMGERACFRTGLAEPGAPGADRLEGIVRSVDESGRLILDTRVGRLSLASGELSRP